MSLIVAPEAVAVVSPPIVVRPVASRPDTRPVEPADQANAGSSQNQQNATSRDAANGSQEFKPTPSARPPGTDPSLPPQALFDASLISEDFKPRTPVADAPDQNVSSSRGRSPDQSSSETGSASSTSDAQDGSQQIGQRNIAAYDRVQGGSPLTLSGTANPDWLSAVEKIA